MQKDKVFLIGVGGIGMSALARYFLKLGKQVGGYDRSTNKLTKQLQAEGVVLGDRDDADAIPHPFRDAEQTLIIYTPAIPRHNAIRSYFEEEGFRLYKRAEILGLISRALKTVAVSGTHGKTTVSAMLSYLLKSTNLKINAFLGGISSDFGTNLILEEGAELMVTEADEFDRSFLQLQPDLAVITSVDADHLDIYSDKEDMLKTYLQFVEQVNVEGPLLAKARVIEELGIKDRPHLFRYGLEDEKAYYSAEALKVENGNYVFDLRIGDRLVKGLRCGLPGLHNVENATAALGLCHQLGMDPEDLKAALAKFSGVMRRFDVHIKRDDLVYIDDYAHHPEEIRMLLRSVRELYPSRKILTVFQPHLYSRTRDLADEFAEALSLSDDLILLELYPAREEPIEGIDSLWLSKKVNIKNIAVCQKSQLMNVLKEKQFDVLLTVGAGDIDQMVEPITDYYFEEALDK